MCTVFYRFLIDLLDTVCPFFVGGNRFLILVSGYIGLV